jgi:hypothetical protein
LRLAVAVVSAAALLLVPAACKEENLLGPPVPCTADDLVTLTVSSGPGTRFSWSPTCLAFRLAVVDTAGTYLWEIEADSGNTLASGITYGVVPDNATETVPSSALVAGRRYVAGLFRRVGPPPADSVAEVQVILFQR